MATIDPIKTPSRLFTLMEAFEYIKHQNRQPTLKTTQWVNVKTGENIVLGVANSSSK